MYSFVGTNEKIMSNSEVVKALKKLNNANYDVLVTITRGDVVKDGAMFKCKIAGTGIVRTECGEQPDFATKNAVNSYIDAFRKNIDTRNTRKLNDQRKARNIKRTPADDEILM